MADARAPSKPQVYLLARLALEYVNIPFPGSREEAADLIAAFKEKDDETRGFLLAAAGAQPMELETGPDGST
jgi:hypothetical protein